MLANRKLAEERRLARLKNQCAINNNDNTQSHQEPTTSNVSDNDKLDSIEIDKMLEHDVKINRVRHHVLDSIESSDEDEALAVNESVRADIHNTVQNNDNIEENSTNNAKDDNYDEGKENHQGLEILQNNKRFDKSNDDIEENLTSNDKNDIYDKTSEILNICSNNGNKLIENEMNGAETMSSYIQESTNKDEIPDQVNSNNQITYKNQVNNDENVENLMDVDFSDDF